MNVKYTLSSNSNTIVLGTLSSSNLRKLTYIKHQSCPMYLLIDHYFIEIMGYKLSLLRTECFEYVRVLNSRCLNTH